MSVINVNQDAFERYIDTSVAVFMELYAAASLDRVRSSFQSATNISSTDMDQKYLAVIKKECRKQKVAKNWKNIRKFLSYAAVSAIILMALTSLLFITVDAVRNPIIDHYVTFTEMDGHWHITGSKYDAMSPKETFDPTDPLAGLLPDGYMITTLENHTSEKYLTAIYDNDTQQSVFFSMRPSSGTALLNSENAKVSRKIRIKRCEAVYVETDDNISLAWFHKKTGVLFTLVASDLSERQIIAIAEHIIELLE